MAKSKKRQKLTEKRKKDNPYLISISVIGIIVLLFLIFLLFSIPGLIDSIRSYLNPNAKITAKNPDKIAGLDPIVKGDKQEKLFGLSAGDKAFVSQAVIVIEEAIMNSTLNKTIYNSSNLPCLESDSGLDFYHRGITVGFWAADSEPYTYEPSYQIDTCNAGLLYEMVCRPIARKPNMLKMIGQTYECPNGCNDGACICNSATECAIGEECSNGTCTLPVVG